MRDFKSSPQALAVRLALLVVAAVVLVFLSRQGWLGPVESAVAYVAVPISRALDTTTGAASYVLGSLQETRNLREENAALRRTVEELLPEVAKLRGAEIENRTLREQLGYVQTNTEWKLVPAQVIGRDPTNLLDVIIIDRGSSGGMEAGMVVVTHLGVIGKITKVTSYWSKVRLITSPSSAVNVVVQGGTRRTFGIIYGTSDGRLEMRYILQTEELDNRDLVVTSGIGGGFPRNFVVGKVTDIQQEDYEVFQTALIDPFVDFSQIEHVMVVADFVPLPLEEREYLGPAQ
jgi:rod shape-determining protein MreC